MTERSQAALVALSEWIDAGNSDRDPEALTLHRLIKLTEESGEVVTATIGAFGANPRKGVTNTFEKVLDELLDVAITALGAYEHIDGHQGRALSELDDKIVRVAQRAGAIEPDQVVYEPGLYEAERYPLTKNYNPYRFDGTKWFEVWEDGTEHDLTEYYREIEEIGPMRRLA